MIQVEGDFLDSMRNVGDSSADTLVASIVQQHQESSLYTYLQLPENEVMNNDSNAAIRNFLLTPRSIPSWFNHEKILQGQVFFRKYALDIMTLLGSMSLPYCYAAAPGNKAIYLTEKMRKTPGKRLVETAHFIIAVMEPGCFNADAAGHIHINKTRLIHALVRHFLQTKAKWNLQWGLPVNQEDMAGTNLAFSYIILVGLEQCKYPITQQEKEDFLFTWQYIGYQLNIQNNLLPADFIEAKQLEHAIRKRHFKESAEGKLLMAELIKHYKEAFPPVASYFVDGQIRYFLGTEISSLLGLEREPVKDFMIKKINTLKEWLNRRYLDQYSYQKMLKNHRLSKEKYKV